MIGSPQKKILVADDNKDAADSTAMFLELVGFETSSAHSGQAAFDTAERRRPNAIILDIGMPDRDGYDVARSIRATEWGKTVFLIAVTGWGQVSDVEKARTSGFNQHMTKPVDPHQLQKVLTDFFSVEV
jgi:CheY-like chemotaxis protein